MKINEITEIMNRHAASYMFVVKNSTNKSMGAVLWSRNPMDYWDVQRRNFV